MNKIYFFTIFLILVSGTIFGLMIFNHNKNFGEELLQHTQEVNKVKQEQKIIDENFGSEQKQKITGMYNLEKQKKLEDQDNDGLTYDQEQRLGTSDNEVDSDSDGINDFEDDHPAGAGKTYRISVNWMHNGLSHTTQFGIPEDWYLHYKKQPRGFCCKGWEKFATPDDLTIKTIAKDIADVSISTGESNKFALAVDFVQSMIYQYDINYNGRDEYPKFAIETIIDKKGDCEDTSFLMASILEGLGLDSILFILPGHVAVGVFCEECSGKYYRYKGKKYYFLETTMESGRWKLGETDFDLSKDVALVIEV